MQKIGILGGTFNPIHNGHIRLAEACDKELHFDKILLIPTNLPPHKQAPELCSNQDRYNMCKLAVKGNPLFEVSDIEFRLGGTSYTYRTLQALKKQCPDSVLYLIVGSDMFFTFRQWKRYEEILSMCILVAASRNPMEHEKMLEMQRSFSHEGFTSIVIRNEVYPLSSTELRELMKAGKEIVELVPPAVLAYIEEHRLFSDKEKDLK